jgi:aryl-alcohol dehydrogenase-like predicted oxidoreductase
MNAGLGTANFGTIIPETQAHKVLNTFIETGGTIIDTANNYAFWAGRGGESELVSKGVVRKLGISNYSLPRIIALQNMIEHNGLVPVSYAQYRHTVIAPLDNADFGVQICLSSDMIRTLKTGNPKIKFVAYSPLLKGAFEPGETLPEKYASETNQQTVNAIREEAGHAGISPSALVLKKIADQGIMPLTMTGKPERLRSNLQLF